MSTGREGLPSEHDEGEAESGSEGPGWTHNVEEVPDLDTPPAGMMSRWLKQWREDLSRRQVLPPAYCTPGALGAHPLQCTALHCWMGHAWIGSCAVWIGSWMGTGATLHWPWMWELAT